MARFHFVKVVWKIVGGKTISSIMRKHSKHSNQVRIIGGQCRGRKLNFVEAEGLRPTPDSVREKLFNWLGQDLTGMSVLDLFAGSGALGFEAASRNAKKVVLADNNRKTTDMLRQNVRMLGLDQIEILDTDGPVYLKRSSEKFDVVFLDPPFAWENWENLFTSLKNNLKKGAMVYIEAGRMPDFPEWLEKYREGRAGKSGFILLHFVQITE